MANTASARKRIRQTVVRTARNKARKSRVHTFVRHVEDASEVFSVPIPATTVR